MYPPPNHPDDDRLNEVIAVYLENVERGEQPDPDALVAQYPEFADQLRSFLANHEQMRRVATKNADQEQATPRQSSANEPTIAHDTPSDPYSLAAAEGRIFGDYELLEEIARGGMGVVYKARQTSLNRIVALKMILAGQLAGEDDVRRFRSEAEAAANLDHAGIVPIFEVGVHEGQHYFSMGYVEGHSLTDRMKDGPLPPREAAEIIKQVVDALAYAHERGVIHRDLKPSNVLLDASGAPKVTDFGLAKRIEEDSNLTSTGQILGTPSYMPPEQAAGKTQQAHKASDVYSLGAMLYALLSGRPPFQADNPLDTIMQVLEQDPVEPRRLNPNVPLDLETICLKCLQKSPANRYQDACELADDLQAFLEDREIAARRTSVWERMGRWERKHRRVTTAAVVSTLIAVAAVVGTALASWQYRDAQTGRLEVSTDGSGLVGEVLDDKDVAVAASFPVPNPQPVTLPAGSYRLRVSTPGLPSQTWPLDIERGKTNFCRVNAESPWLWPPVELPVDEQWELEPLALADNSDLFLISHGNMRSTAQRFGRMRRLDGRTGRAVWPHDAIFDTNTAPDADRVDEWETLLFPASVIVGPLDGKDQQLVRPGPDLDGDAVGEIVFLSRQSPSVVAISGKAGSILWWHRGQPQPLPEDIDGNWRRRRRGLPGTVIGQPAVYDVDDDDTLDFIVCFAAGGETYTSPTGQQHSVAQQGWIAAISGKTGEALWTHSTGNRWQAVLRPSRQTLTHYHTTFHPVVVTLHGKLAVVLIAENLLFGLHLHDGTAMWEPYDLGQTVLREPVFADVDDQGPPELLLLQEKLRGAGRTLTALRLDTREPLWSKSFTPGAHAEDYEESNEGFCFTEDLDADGKPEVVFPIVQHRHHWRYSMAGLQVLNGATGQTLWRRRLAVTDPNNRPLITRATSGPDINGDNYRELFVAWTDFADYGRRNFVAALSGKSGLALWKSPVDGMGTVEDLSWWQLDADGWPLLVVADANSQHRQSTTLVLSAATGRITHALPGVRKPLVRDFSGDGIPDLAYEVTPQGAPRLLVVPGREPTPWRAFDQWHVAQDFDNDGYTDLLHFNNHYSDARLTARSGRSGQDLWETPGPQSKSTREFKTPPLPAGDLNGDGAPDLFVFNREYRKTDYGATAVRRISAMSGRNGQCLWTARDVEMDSGGSSGSKHSGTWSYEIEFPSMDWCDLDQDGRADALVAHIHEGAEHFSLISGKTGDLLWQVPVPRRPFGMEKGRGRHDLDGDGVLDLIVGEPQNENPLFHVLSGSSGKSIWHSHALTTARVHALLAPPGAGDLNGDGDPEVVVACTLGTQCKLISLAGRTGEKQWSWNWRQKNRDILPPLLISAHGNTSGEIWMGIRENETSQIVAVDASGQVISRLELKDETIQDVFPFWASADLDGDGREEVLLLKDGDVCALRAGSGEVLWRWNLPPHRQQREYTSLRGQLVEILPADSSNAATVVVWTNQTVFGIDGQAGRTRWKCRVPWSPGTGFSHPPEVALLSAGATSAAPRILCRWSQFSGDSSSTMIRQSLPVSTDGEYQIPRPTPVSYEPLTEAPLPKRKLPWAPPRRGTGTWSLESSAIAFPLGLPTLLIVVIPTWLVWWAIRRRSWQLALLPACYAGLSTFGPLPDGVSTLIALLIPGYVLYWGLRQNSWPLMLLAPTLAAVTCAPFLSLYVIQSDSPMANVYRWHRLGELFAERLLLAVICTPGLCFWALTYLGLRHRDWKNVRRLLIASVLLAVVFAVLFLMQDARNMASWEAYDLYAWYGILFWGTYATGAICLLALAVRKSLHLVRRLRYGGAAAVRGG